MLNRDPRDEFEKRMEEIDRELTRYDSYEGNILGVDSVIDKARKSPQNLSIILMLMNIHACSRHVRWRVS